jgi:ATP adenylyltransferase
MAKKSSPKKKAARSSAKASAREGLAHLKKLRSDIWPLERDVLFRPDRYKYVRKLVKPEGCVFCSAKELGVGFESLCVYESKHSMILLNKYPYNSGHLLIVPKSHKGNMLDLTDAEYLDAQECIRLAAKALDKIYEPSGLNLGLNQGEISGAGIPQHLHYHLIPRWAGDLNFFPLIAETKVVIESLEMSFDRLINFFK